MEDIKDLHPGCAVTSSSWNSFRPWQGGWGFSGKSW